MSGIKTYITETVNEMVHNVTWPTWSDLQKNTVIVVLASLAFSFLIFFMDYIVGISSSTGGWNGLMGIIYKFFI